jgi:hypothetical protein
MQRCQRAQLVYRLDCLIVNQDGVRILFATMNYAVADGNDVGKGSQDAQFRAGQQVNHLIQGGGVVWQILIAIKFLAASGNVNGSMRLADVFDQAFAHEFFIEAVSKLEFDGG